MIQYLIPDMPDHQALMPFLKEIDETRWYSNFGPLEQRLRQETATKFFPEFDEHNVLTCSSGTAAISLALRGLNRPRGSYVVLPAYTFPGTISAVFDSGFKPILADVDPDTWQLTPETAAWYVERFDVAAVVTVATFGVPVDAHAWTGFQNKHQVPVIVDAAAALGQQQLGDLILCFSLHATKLIGAGEGGLVVAKDPNFIECLRRCSNFGYDQGEVRYSGSNLKLSEYHAAVGLAQYNRAEQVIDSRKDIYNRYRELLSDSGNSGEIVFQKAHSTDVPSSLVLKFPSIKGQDVLDALIKKNIQTRQLYCPALHKHRGLSPSSLWFPKKLDVASSLGESTLALPYHNFLSEKDIKNIVHELIMILDLFNSSKKLRRVTL